MINPWPVHEIPDSPAKLGALHFAPVLIGILHTPERFRSVRHLRGFSGLFPNRTASGGADKPGQRITQAGNDRIKRALILAADTARRVDPELAAVYHRLMTLRGHHHKQALCAVANHLVNHIFRVLREDDGTRRLEDFMEPPHYVPESKRVDDLLQDFLRLLLRSVR